MRRLHHAVFASLAIAMGPATLFAQVVTYARAPGDTLHFRETTRIEGTSKGRAGNQNVAINMRAHISLAFVTADSARAWYDSLSVGVGSVNRNQEIPTQTALRAPFVLRVHGTGAVETLRAPELPPFVRDIADFTPQFEDFFPRLPAKGLEPGATWTDTIVHREGASPGRQLFTQYIIHGEVDGDTIVDGESAVRIRTSTELRIESTIPIQREAYTARLVLTGTETGSAVVTRNGRLWRRDRSGEIHGATEYRTGATDIAVDQSYTFRLTLTALDPPR